MNTENIYEAMGNINEEYIKMAHATVAKKRPVWIKWSAIAACFVAIIIATATLLSNLKQPDIAPSDDNMFLVVNHLKQPPAIADIDGKITNYNDISYNAWQLTMKEFETFTGISYKDFESRLPESLRENMIFYSLATRKYKDNHLEDTYYLHDYIFDCKSKDDVFVRIAICNFEEPIRDYIIDNKTPKLSKINQTPAIIYEYDGLYLVQFSHNGLNYDIETQRMDLKQLQQLLVNIVV